MDRGLWWAVVHGVTKSQTRQQLSAAAEFDSGTFLSFLKKSESRAVWGECLDYI